MSRQFPNRDAFDRWLPSATRTQLQLEKSDLWNWLNLPSARLWAEDYAEAEYRLGKVVGRLSRDSGKQERMRAA